MRASGTEPTGTYLWWTGRRTRGKAPGSARGRLRRLHVWVGVGSDAVVVFLVLSGLPWSGVWGDGLQRIQERTGSTAPNAGDFPHTSTPPLSGDLSAHPDAKVPWAAERLPVPESASSASYGWAEYGTMAKVVEQGIALHEGRRYGPANLVVMLAACLALITLVVTGVWMWWKRRPRGRAGAPARPSDRRTAYGVIAVMAVLGLLFPLAGVTMAATLLLDRLVLRRIPAVARFAG
ncbi:PepSY domain-containing protein [Nonomuraea turkmeniaca]|uniref:PepSY domain-containing protein n=1 Tax=Nonomuraea turkmeniaca TaxID=103838 RepID=UPI001477068D|nr:PepSY domain-containing protein [Nonomuraea turkmeniaca]